MLVSDLLTNTLIIPKYYFPVLGDELKIFRDLQCQPVDKKQFFETRLTREHEHSQFETERACQ